MKRWTKLILGTALPMLALSLSVGCGDSDNPDAIDVKNLKYASNLKILDNGNGSVRLTWTGTNFEEKFQGYNVYGIKMDDAKIAELANKGLEKGKPLELLDSNGDARDEAKEVLAEFNYNGSDLNTKKDTVDDDGKRKISFLPIHAKDGDDPILPTCNPSTDTNGDSICEATTASSNLDNETQNGPTYYEVSGLTYGDQYCFLIFSVQDEGEEISQTSTNFECVTPRIRMDLTIDNKVANAATASYKHFKISPYAEACKTAGTCPTFDSTYLEVLSSQTGENTTVELAIESYGASSDKVNFVPGKNCGILHYGYKTGLDDPTLPLDPPTFDNGVISNTVQNSNGYSVAGQSIVLTKSQVFALACRDTETGRTDKTFYHWIYVYGITGGTTAVDPIESSTFDVTVQLATVSI